MQIRTFQSNLTGGELSPDMQSRPDVVKYQTGVDLGQNVTIKPQGGMTARNGTTIVAEVADSAVRGQLRAFEIGPGETYVLEFGDDTLRFVRDGALVLDAAAAVTATAVTAAAPAVFTLVAHGLTTGTRVFVDQIADDDLDEVFFDVGVVAADTFQLIDMWGVVVSRAGKAALGSARVTPDYRVVTPYAFPRTARVTSAQDQDVAFLLSNDNAPQRLTRIAADDWTLAAETFQPGIAAPASPAVTALVGTGAITYKYKVSAIDGETGEESLPSAEASITNDLTVVDNTNEMTWLAVTGAVRYIVYKEDNGVFGYIGGTEALLFVDENIGPDLSDAPQQGRNPFNATGDYPTVGTMFEQRLFLASTDNNPAGVWGSQSANNRNFGVSSPLKESDAITFRVRANRVTKLQGLVSTDALLAMASQGEWSVSAGEQQGYLTPLNPLVRQRKFYGSAAIEPLPVGEVVLHVQRGGHAMRAFQLGQTGPSPELTLLATHLFETDAIVNIAHQQSPDGVVWAVTDTGKLRSMSYMPEHEIWGWTRHELGGSAFVEDIAVVEEFDADTLYMLVRRTINGQTKRYIERLAVGAPRVATDAYHVDCGRFLAFDPPTDTIKGLHHLEGETLVALVDGNVVRDLLVTDGQVTLPDAGAIVAIGLSYTARIITLDLDMGPLRDAGSIMERYKTITDVRLRVTHTRGIFVAHADADLAVEYKQRAGEAWGDAIALFTGTVEVAPRAQWSTGGRLIIEQFDPLPMTINGILIDWEFGE